MNNSSNRLLVVFVSLAVLSTAAICLAAEGGAGAAKKTPWKITGQLEEACTCDAACPCWFGSKPTKMTCGGYQVLFIERGYYGRTPLRRLAVAQIVESPEGKSMMESVGNWKFTNYYIDERANPDQRAALLALAKSVFPPESPKSEVRYVPITRTIEGKEHHITIGQFGKFSGHLVEGGLGGAPRVVNPPLADPIHHEYQQGRTSKLAMNDAGQNWNASESNYMFGTFTVDSEEFEKWGAGLAQKMAQMKKP